MRFMLLSSLMLMMVIIVGDASCPVGCRCSFVKRRIVCSEAGNVISADRKYHTFLSLKLKTCSELELSNFNEVLPKLEFVIKPTDCPIALTTQSHDANMGNTSSGPDESNAWTDFFVWIGYIVCILIALRVLVALCQCLKRRFFPTYKVTRVIEENKSTPEEDDDETLQAGSEASSSSYTTVQETLV